MEIGARYVGEGKCKFVVWAPFLNDLTRVIAEDKERVINSEKDDAGYWIFEEDNIFPGMRYFYSLRKGRAV